MSDEQGIEWTREPQEEGWHWFVSEYHPDKGVEMVLIGKDSEDVDWWWTIAFPEFGTDQYQEPISEYPGWFQRAVQPQPPREGEGNG